MTDRFYVKTCAEAVARWDADQLVWSVTMGGLGPGYEQAIQICVFEMLRHPAAKTLHPILDELDKALRLSGAQANAALQLASAMLRDGYQETLGQFAHDRLIQVSRSFPKWPPSIA